MHLSLVLYSTLTPRVSWGHSGCVFATRGEDWSVSPMAPVPTETLELGLLDAEKRKGVLCGKASIKGLAAHPSLPGQPEITHLMNTLKSPSLRQRWVHIGAVLCLCSCSVCIQYAG